MINKVKGISDTDNETLTSCCISLIDTVNLLIDKIAELEKKIDRKQNKIVVYGNLTKT